jgi:uncharacterized protein YndB with AHSA1/START domain
MKAWIAALSLVLAAPAAAQSSSILIGELQLHDGSQLLIHEVTIDAPAAEVWAAISTAEGWRGWAAPVVWSGEGLIETSYTPTAARGDPSTIVQEIGPVIPRRLFAFRTTKAPARFPDFETFRRVWQVLELWPQSDGRTRVRLTGASYPPTDAGRRLLDFFKRGNSVSLDSLRKSLESRQKAIAPAASKQQ